MNNRVLVLRLYDWLGKNQEKNQCDGWTTYTIAEVARSMDSNWATVRNWLLVLERLGVFQWRWFIRGKPQREYRVKWDKMRRFIGINRKPGVNSEVKK